MRAFINFAFICSVQYIPCHSIYWNGSYYFRWKRLQFISYLVKLQRLFTQNIDVSVCFIYETIYIQIYTHFVVARSGIRSTNKCVCVEFSNGHAILITLFGGKFVVFAHNSHGLQTAAVTRNDIAKRRCSLCKYTQFRSK